MCFTVYYQQFTTTIRNLSICSFMILKHFRKKYPWFTDIFLLYLILALFSNIYIVTNLEELWTSINPFLPINIGLLIFPAIGVLIEIFKYISNKYSYPWTSHSYWLRGFITGLLFYFFTVSTIGIILTLWNPTQETLAIILLFTVLFFPLFPYFGALIGACYEYKNRPMPLNILIGLLFLVCIILGFIPLIGYRSRNIEIHGYGEYIIETSILWVENIISTLI